MDELTVEKIVYANGIEVIVLVFSGYIDATTVVFFERTVSGRAGNNGSGFVLDFSNVGYISSVGWETVGSLARDMGESGSRLVVAGMRGPINNLFILSGFSSVIDSFASSGEALRFFFKEAVPRKRSQSRSGSGEETTAARRSRPVKHPGGAPGMPPPAGSRRRQGAGAGREQARLHRAVRRIVSRQPYISIGDLVRELRAGGFKTGRRSVRYTLHELGLRTIHDRYELAFRYRSLADRPSSDHLSGDGPSMDGASMEG